jgi:hypothetical protein
MKKFLIIVFISMGIYANAQENLAFSKVIKTDSVGKYMIYTTIMDWFATVYGSSKEVIKMSDKDAGVIIGKGLFDYSHRGKGFGWSCFDGTIKYTIRIDIKDNRYKVTLSDFNHTNKLSNSGQCAMGFLTTSESFVPGKPKDDIIDVAWKDMKLQSENYSNNIFNELENKTKNLKNANDDW